MEKGLSTVSKPLTHTTADKAPLQDTAAPSFTHRRELARRLSGGIEVTLYWSPDDNTTHVEVSQPAIEEALRFNVPCERALDAFYHPFSHLTAGERGGTPDREQLWTAEADQSLPAGCARWRIRFRLRPARRADPRPGRRAPTLR